MRCYALTGLLLLILAMQVYGQADSSGVVVINGIHLEGNKITRPKIILREMKFKTGDTVSAGEFPLLLERSRENVFNTSLFNVVEIDADTVDGDPRLMDVKVRVIERWYIWPMPYLEFPNKNINAWLETFDFRKLTYGVNFKFFNARGRNETLTLLLHFGFNQQYGFTYQTPYLDRKQTLGFGFGGSFSQNKSLMVSTTGNKGEYIDTTSGFLQRHANGFVQGYYRPSLYSHHTLSVSYDYFVFADTLLQIPGYLTDSTNDQSFFTLYYKYKLDHRDVRYYPLKGYYFDLEMTNHGFSSESFQLFSIKSAFRKYWRFTPRWYWASGLTAKWSYPEEQPFFLQRGLGYERDFIRGFEYYTINGPWFLLLKNNLKFALVKPRVMELPFIKNPKFGVVPWGLFLNLFVDIGYVSNPIDYVKEQNNLVNTFLAGYGISIDFITYYDLVIDLNFALNSLGEPGIYIHFIAPI
jgi:outer membrane protein assembly factor BamA